MEQPEENNKIDGQAWLFCPGKKCYWCRRDIGQAARLNGRYVTACPFCSHSFVD